MSFIVINKFLIF